jgi:hypothetical protein
METRNQKLIREILGDDEEGSDTSLQAQTLRRARSQEPPTTLTPFEWEQWYREHGVPESHRRAQAAPPRRSWWRRLLRR